MNFKASNVFICFLLKTALPLFLSFQKLSVYPTFPLLHKARLPKQFELLARESQYFCRELDKFDSKLSYQPCNSPEFLHH